MMCFWDLSVLRNRKLQVILPVILEIFTIRWFENSKRKMDVDFGCWKDENKDWAVMQYVNLIFRRQGLQCVCVCVSQSSSL